MNRIAHVVGNGPSWTDFRKINSEDFVIGCNMTKCPDADVTMLTDIKLYTQWMHLLRWKRDAEIINVPVIASNKVVEHMSVTEDNRLQVYSTYEKVFGAEPLQLSSGHYGVLWAIDNGYTDIHVWGIDSYFKNHIYSYTDERIKSDLKKDPERVKNVADRWVIEWDKIIADHPEIRITLHAPSAE